MEYGIPISHKYHHHPHQCILSYSDPKIGTVKSPVIRRNTLGYVIRISVCDGSQSIRELVVIVCLASTDNGSPIKPTGHCLCRTSCLFTMFKFAVLLALVGCALACECTQDSPQFAQQVAHTPSLSLPLFPSPHRL